MLQLAFSLIVASILISTPQVSSSNNDRQFHIQTDEGPERYFKYQTTNGQYRKEKRLEDGTVIGSYAWIDDNGFLRQRDYIADSKGYRILQNKNVYVGKGTDVGDAVKTTKKITKVNSRNNEIYPPKIYLPTSSPTPFYLPSREYPQVHVSSTIAPPSSTLAPPTNAYLQPTPAPPTNAYLQPTLAPPTNVYLPSTLAPPETVYLPQNEVYISSTPAPPSSTLSPPSSQYIPSSTPSNPSVYVESSTPPPISYLPSSPAPFVRITPPPKKYIPAPLESNSIEEYTNPYIHQNGPTYPIDNRGRFFNPIGNGYDPQYPYYDGISVTNDGFRYYIPRAYHEEQKQGGVGSRSNEKSGSFGYIDPFGIRRVVYYNAGADGFKVRKNNRYVGFNATPYDPRPY